MHSRWLVGRECESERCQMAKILGGQLLSAREGAYFKSEQESDLHYYLRKRVKSGELVIPEEAKAAPAAEEPKKEAKEAREARRTCITHPANTKAADTS